MRTPRAVVLLCFLAVLAGCVGVGSEATQSPPTIEDNATATVVDVVDGDTIDVRYEDGTTDTVRLLGIDTPEVRADNEPAEFEGVPENEAGVDCLYEAGNDASAALRDRIAGEQVTIVVDPVADRRDRYDRLLAYVEVDGTDINHWLIAAGHARVYDSAFSRSDAYYAAESNARNAGIGVWDCRSSGSDTTTTGTSALESTDLTVDWIHADAAGNDHENPNDEYVVFRNAGDDTLDVGGWIVRDEAGASYTVPDGTSIAPDSMLTLRSGSGTDTDETLYWGRESAVWNNGGDTATVTDADGRVVVQYSYP